MGQLRVCDRGADCARLLAQRLRRCELAGEQMHTCSQIERQRQHGQRAGIPGELDLPVGEHEPALVIPQVHGGPAREPQPADPLIAGEFVTTERAQCPLQHRRPSGIALRVEHGQPVEEEIGRPLEAAATGVPGVRHPPSCAHRRGHLGDRRRSPRTAPQGRSRAQDRCRAARAAWLP